MSENEMGDRGSKSILFLKNPTSHRNNVVKEQRVDGSYFLKRFLFTKLRCTLMGCENSYQFKIPSKQFGAARVNPAELTKLKFYSSLNVSENKEKLNPWFITGFTDAEGCFSIKVQPNAKLKTKWRIRPVFSITLNSKDLNLLESFKYTLGTGTISKSGKSSIFAVESVKDLPLIIDHFDKYPLITKKISDYIIFKECYEIIAKKEHLNETGLLKILSLKSSLNLGLPDSLKTVYPKLCIPKNNKPEYLFNGIPDPFWVSGFTSGDGSFHVVNVKNNGKTTGVLARFSIHLNVRDLEVLKGLSTYFKSLNFSLARNIENTEARTKVSLNCVTAWPSENKKIIISENSANLQISKFSDVTDILIPFFNKYPILGVKSLDFADFKLICNLMQTKNDLNKALVLEKILYIKSNMNLRRKIK